MLETMLRFKGNLDDPRMRAELSEAIENHNQRLIESDLKNENSKIISTSHLEKSVYKFTKEFEEFLIKERMTSTGDPGALGNRILKFLNKNFKGMTFGPALGRVFTESAQAGITSLVERLDTMRNYRVPDGAKLPEAGNLNKNQKFSSREFSQHDSMWGSSVLTTKDGPLAAMLSKPVEFFQKLQNGVMDPSLGRIENYMYHSLFQKKYMEQAMALDGYKGNPDGWDWKSSKHAYLFKDQITSENATKKANFIQKIKREARTEASKMFFDYGENPLLVQKMEQLIPFTNYMYSGVRMISRYPKSMLFMATMLNNMQYAYGEDVWYNDDEGNRIDAGISLRMPILASIGLGGVGLNVQRFLQFSPANTSLSPLPIFSYLTNRDDFRFKTFYESGKINDLVDASLVTMGWSLWQLMRGIKNLDQPYDKGYNPVADISQTLVYMITGSRIKDKTQATAWKNYIEKKDFDYLLGLSPLQLDRFLSHPSNKWMTKESLEMAKMAQDIGLLSKDWKKWGLEMALETLAWRGIVEKSFSKDDYNTHVDAIQNLLEIVLGNKFSAGSGGGNFEEYLAKAITMAENKNFKYFEAYNKKLYDTWKRYADNKEYYYGTIKVGKLLSQADTRVEWVAMNIALKYHFEGDEGMNFEEKKNALMSGKLTKVKTTNGSEEFGVPPWPMMTEWYFNSLSGKWDLVVKYMDQANKVIAYQKGRKFFNQLAYTQTSDEKKSQYFDIGRNLYNSESEAYRLFKMTATPEFELFLLSEESQSFLDRMKKSEDFFQDDYRKKAKVSAKKWDKLVSMDEKEKKAMSATFGMNVDQAIINRARDMVTDSNNVHYYKETQYPEKLSSIINSIK